MKIRWRRHRTCSSQARQSTASQPRISSSGPFARRSSWRPTCPSVLVSTSSSSSQAHLTASAPFRVRARCPVSGQLSRTAGGGASHHVSVSRCLSAAGIRFSVIRFPPGDWAFLTVGLPDKSPDPDGVTTFRTHELRPGWVPSYTPGTAVLIPAGRRSPPAPAASQRPVPTPRSNIPSLRGSLTRHQRGFKQFTRPVFPSPVAPGWNGALGLSPELRTPPITGDARRGGDRPMSTGLELRVRHQPNLQSASFSHHVRPRVALGATGRAGRANDSSGHWVFLTARQSRAELAPDLKGPPLKSSPCGTMGRERRARAESQSAGARQQSRVLTPVAPALYTAKSRLAFRVFGGGLEVGHEGRSWFDPHDASFVLPYALKERGEQAVALGRIIFAVPKAPEVALTLFTGTPSTWAVSLTPAPRTAITATTWRSKSLTAPRNQPHAQPDPLAPKPHPDATPPSSAAATAWKSTRVRLPTRRLWRPSR